MKYIFSFSLIIISFCTQAQGIDTSYCKKITLKKSVFGAIMNPINQNTMQQELKPTHMLIGFDPNTLPFFCKIEYKMGITTKVPIKIRLGDPDKVDEMEKKGINRKMGDN